MGFRGEPEAADSNHRPILPWPAPVANTSNGMRPQACRSLASGEQAALHGEHCRLRAVARTEFLEQ